MFGIVSGTIDIITELWIIELILLNYWIDSDYFIYYVGVYEKTNLNVFFSLQFWTRSIHGFDRVLTVARPIRPFVVPSRHIQNSTLSSWVFNLQRDTSVFNLQRESSDYQPTRYVRCSTMFACLFANVRSRAIASSHEWWIILTSEIVLDSCSC